LLHLKISRQFFFAKNTFEMNHRKKNFLQQIFLFFNQIILIEKFFVTKKDFSQAN